VPGRAVPGRRIGRRLAAAGAAALVLLAGAGAYAADSWAKSDVCDAVQALGKGRSPSTGKPAGKKSAPTAAEFGEAEDQLNNRARLLFFHGDLSDATHGLADDIASIRHFAATADTDDLDSAEFTRMLALAASLDGHARKAQRACGVPERSLFDKAPK
jgi:hypothetical protein